ncbi:hypothetical protein BGX28_000502 [Mortierella sp. GBA30]|nr:hypothetical protein BGX28_000502 [Mortierella sp. GBA30]
MLSRYLPQLHTPAGLWQFQLTTIGFIVLFALLHISLFMDGLVPHNFFVSEVGTLLLYGLVPSKYTVRPISLLKRRFYMLIGLAAAWIIQPTLLTLNESYSLYNTREQLTTHISEALNKLQLERIQKEGGSLEEVGDQRLYAGQMAAAMQCLAGLSAIVSAMVIVEAVCVLYKYNKFLKEELSSAEKEKQDATTTATTSSASKASGSAKTTKKD